MQQSRPLPDMQVGVEARLLTKEKQLLVAQLESVSRSAKLLKKSIKSNRRRLVATKIFGKLQERKLRDTADESEQIRRKLQALAAHQDEVIPDCASCQGGSNAVCNHCTKRGAHCFDHSSSIAEYGAWTCSICETVQEWPATQCARCGDLLCLSCLKMCSRNSPCAEGFCDVKVSTTAPDTPPQIRLEKSGLGPGQCPLGCS